MELPDYFLADLPADAVSKPEMLTEACRTLKRNRTSFLAGRSLAQIIGPLSAVARSWLDSEYPLRRHLLEAGPQATGFSRETLEHGVDSFFQELTPEAFEELILQDLGHRDRLIELVSDGSEVKRSRASVARTPELLVHIAGGVLPNSIWTSMLIGLLARSAQFVKCASGRSFLPRMLAHSIYDEDPKLGACMEVAEWKGGQEALEGAVFQEADCVTVTGADRSVDAVRAKVPRHVRVVAYGERVSFGYVAREALAGMQFTKAVRAAAQDVVAWDQLGCLSPHVIYVETGGVVSAEAFADALARSLEALEQERPRGRIEAKESAIIATRRSFYEVRAAHALGTRVWMSKGSTAWTVIYEEDPLFQLSSLNRFVYVKAAGNLELALRGAEAVRGQVSTVGVAAPLDRTQAMANELARWGATRVCPLGRMQQPPFCWRHDGRPALGDLITWSDWEF